MSDKVKDMLNIMIGLSYMIGLFDLILLALICVGD